MEIAEQAIALAALGISAATTIVGWLSLRKKTNNGGSMKTALELEREIIELEKKIARCEMLHKKAEARIEAKGRKIETLTHEKNRLVDEIIRLKQ